MTRIVICTLMKPEFREKFEKYLQEESEAYVCEKNEVKSLQELLEKGVEQQRIDMQVRWQKLNKRSSWHMMWNNKDMDSYHKPIEYEDNGVKKSQTLAEYYQELGLWEVETYEEEFEYATKGYQSNCRIIYKGEIQKVDDIDEIISWKFKKEQLV